MPISKNMESAFKDITVGFKSKSVWLILAQNDVKTRYHRSKIGVVWAGLSLLIFVGVLGPIYASLMQVELREYMFHLLLGFVVWNYLSGIISESGREYINSPQYLISFQLSYFSLLLRVVWRNLTVFAYQMLIFFMFAIFFSWEPSFNWVFAPVALIVITLNALWMGMLVSIFTTRYRDVDEILNNVLRLVFFATPIIWIGEIKPELMQIVTLNPFYHLIEIFRSALMGGEPASQSWLFSIMMVVVGAPIAFMVFANCRSRIAFWL